MKDRKINPPEIDENAIIAEKREILDVIRNAILLAKKTSVVDFPWNLPIASISVDNDNKDGELVIWTTSGNEYTIRLKDIDHTGH